MSDRKEKRRSDVPIVDEREKQWVIADEFETVTEAVRSSPALAKSYKVQPNDVRVVKDGLRYQVRIRRSAIQR